jgi:hypothetical protein
MKNDFVFSPPDILSYPDIVNARFGEVKKGKLAIRLHGQNLTDEAFEAYSELMDKFELPIAFYPYCECMINSNRVFGQPNPICEVTLLTGNYVDLVRHLNFGVVFYDLDRLEGMQLRNDVGSAFMEAFVDDLKSVGLLKSNGMFIDVNKSWSYFSNYRGMPLAFPEDHRKSIEELKITLDNDLSVMLDSIYQVDKMELMSK